ncbi:MAG: hypothetical protein M1820_005743 [Bogoriella megaspora]|nr:MAG: hypothetical protein M1820_005743 [Bogoriella megaspora]
MEVGSIDSIPGGSVRGTIPLSVVLSWPLPNYIDPVKRTWMTALAVPLQVASTIFLLIRLWSRVTRQTGRFGIDDVFIIASWMFAAVLSAIAIVAADKYSFDKHVWDAPFDQHVPAAMYGWIGDNTFLISTCLCKIAVLLFYRRMVVGTCSKKMIYASWFGIAFTAVYGIVFIVMLCVTCKPLDAYWKSYDPTYTRYQCSTPGAAMPISGAFSVASDFYAVVLPYLLVRNLQIPERQKYGLFFVFGFGLVVVGCGIARTYYLDQLALRSYDTTWVGFEVFASSLLETQLSIIGACLPNLRKMFGSFFGDSLSRVYSGIRHGASKTIGRSASSKYSSTGHYSAPKHRKGELSTEDIELTASSFTETALSTDHENFEKAYLKKHGQARFTEDDLPAPIRNNVSDGRNKVFPHTVF